MFKNVKVGDKVFDYKYQTWGIIYNICKLEIRGIYVKLDCGITESYTVDGKTSVYDKVPMLFWDEVKPITPPKKPLSKLEVDPKVLVLEEKFPDKIKRYFNHFDENGCVYCFN